MKILVTGAFGNVGRRVLDCALSRGHEVSVLEVPSRRNAKAARAYGRRLSAVTWGDIRDGQVLAEAVRGRDAVIHLAAILPPASEAKPALCEAVNVGGTQALLDSLRAEGRGASVVYVSSVSVMGPTQDREPPVRVGDPARPRDAYARSKLAAEALVSASGLPYCVLRLAAVMPTGSFHFLDLLGAAFEIPLGARCELVVDLDVATACVHAAEGAAGDAAIRGRTFFVAGGKALGCQMRGRDMFEGLLGSVGVPMPADHLFTRDSRSYALDWYETGEAQEALRFQEHGFADYRLLLARRLRLLKPLAALARPVVVRFVASRSPYRLLASAST